MHSWSNPGACLGEGRCVAVSRCTVCDGRHEEIVCPCTLTSAGYTVTRADQGILGGHILAESQFVGRMNDALVVSQPAADACMVNAGLLGDSQRIGWRTDGGVRYPGQNLLGIDQAVCGDGVTLSLNASIPRASMASSLLLDAAHPLVERPNVAFIGDALTRVCKTCGSLHIMAGSCPFQVTTSLYETYRGDVFHSLMPEHGSSLRYQASAAVLPVADQGMLTVDSADIFGSSVGMYNSALLHRQERDRVAFERPGAALVSDVNALACVNCGSFHAGLSCLSLALAPYQLHRGDKLSQWLSPERASFSEVMVPSWRSWPTSPTYFAAELGDYLAARVGDAVYDAVASHGIVEGDLIVQVAVIVQAETGAITQIGRISSN